MKHVPPILTALILPIVGGSMPAAQEGFAMQATQSETARSLDPTLDLDQYVHDVWDVADGLPHTTVHTILQTDDGYLWLGTQGGLARFDGVNFRVFDRRNSPAFQSNSVSALLQGDDGSLWIGFRRGGLVRMKDGAFTAFTPEDGLPHRTVYGLHQDAAGTLWIGTEGGLASFDGRDFTTLTTSDGLPANAVEAIEGGSDGSLWIGTRFGGLARLRDGEVTTYTQTNGLGGGSVTSLLQRSDGTLWIATEEGGISVFEDGTLRTRSLPDRVGRSEVNALFEDRAGTLWIGTTGSGLVRIADDATATMPAEQTLSEDRVLSFHEDAEGGLWVGTAEGGLIRLGTGRAVTFGAAQGLTDKRPRTVTGDDAGNLAVAGPGGMYVWNGERFFHHTSTSVEVLTVSIDPDGDLWWGTAGDGLYRMNSASEVSRFDVGEGPAFGHIQVVTQDGDGGLWIGTRGGLSHYTGGRFVSYTVEDGVPTNSVVALLEDREGTLWLGTEGGLARRRRNGSFEALDGTPGVWSFHEDAEGVVWMGTVGGGLYRLDGPLDDRFTVYSSADGLHDDYIWSIVDDGFGFLWMCGDRGIFKVERQELEEFASGRIGRVTSRAYGTADGMKSSQCSSGSQPSSFRASDGALWFATVGGVVRIDPEPVPNPPPPPVYIEQILDEGRALEAADEVVLPPGRHELEFRYTALSFRDPARIRFRYKLDGYDDDWIEAGTERSASYTNLDPGPYTFRVVASHGDGTWSRDDAARTFSISPFVYQTLWFQGLGTSALVLLVFGAHRMRVTRIEKRNRELRSQIEARKRVESELDAQRRELRHILDSVGTQIWYLDREARVLRCNREAQSAVGRCEEELIGSRLIDVFATSYDLDRRHRESLEVVRTGQARIGILASWEAADGTRWAKVDKLPTADKEGNIDGLLVMARDITNLRQAEDDRAQMEAQFHQTQKMETIGTLAAGIAHDFNNILVPILGFTEMVQRSLPDDDVQSQHLGYVLEGGHRAKALVDQILTFSRQVTPERKSVDLAEIVGEALHLIRASLPATIEIQQALGHGNVMADPTQIHQVLMNLCTNAAHAMKDGGVMELKVESIAVDDALFTRSPGLGRRAVRLIVRDTGEGMSPDVLSRIFEPFFTTKDVGEGTGLGLSVIHGIVANHGGLIDVESVQGKGTTFTIHFPLSEAMEQESAEANVDIVHSGGKILFVDDEVPITVLARQLLGELGYECFVTTSGKEALEEFRARPEEYGAVITDMTMPGMTGVELTRELRAIRAEVPVILTSGYTRPSAVEAAKSAGINGYLKKPFTTGDIGQALRAVVAGP